VRKAVIEQVQLGAIDFTRVSVGPVAAFSSILNALQLPYLYRDTDHMVKVLTGKIGQDLLKELESHQFYGIGWFDGGTRNFYTVKKQVKSIADMKGLKFRVMQSDVFVQMIEELGGIAAPMPYGEVYSALQTGVIDGAENNYPSYDTSSHYEVAKYYTEDGHLRVPEIIIGSKIALDKKLKKSDIDVLKKAAEDALSYQMRLWEEKVKVSADKVKAAGNTIIKLSASEKSLLWMQWHLFMQNNHKIFKTLLKKFKL
jgi:tripartite ATP-independent transporter DctP family solute receptor